MASDNGSNKTGSGEAAPAEQETFKQQLDRIAAERRNEEQPQHVHPVVEKSKCQLPRAALASTISPY